MLNRLVIIIFMLFVISACKHNSDVPISPEVSYKNDISPLITGNCTQSSCHGNGEFGISNYNDLLKRTHIKPGNANKSGLFQVVNTYNPSNVMPPKGYNHLNNDQITTIYMWIMQGAKNN